MTETALQLLEEETGFKIREVEVPKGVARLKGIKVMVSDNAGMILYEEMYKNCEDLFELAELIKQRAENNKDEIENISKVNQYLNRDYIKSNCYLTALPDNMYSEDKIMRKIDGISDIVMAVRMNMRDNLSFIVPSVDKKGMDFTDEDVIMWAKDNTFGTEKLENIVDVLSNTEDGQLLDELGMLDCSSPLLIVASNDSKYYGTGVIFDNERLKAFCDEIGTDKLIIIPSSIHELLLVNYYDINEEDANAMVVDVNKSQVEDCEVLSNHIYIYDKASNKVTG